MLLTATQTITDVGCTVVIGASPAGSMQGDQQLNSNDEQTDVWELIRTLVAGQVPASRILELYYWSQEPGVLDLVRWFLSLSQKDRSKFCKLLTDGDPHPATVGVDSKGRTIITFGSTDRTNKAETLAARL